MGYGFGQKSKKNRSQNKPPKLKQGPQNTLLSFFWLSFVSFSPSQKSLCLPFEPLSCPHPHVDTVPFAHAFDDMQPNTITDPTKSVVALHSQFPTISLKVSMFFFACVFGASNVIFHFFAFFLIYSYSKPPSQIREVKCGGGGGGTLPFYLFWWFLDKGVYVFVPNY
jgi:hypothetical protein